MSICHAALISVRIYLLSADYVEAIFMYKLTLSMMRAALVDEASLKVSDEAVVDPSADDCVVVAAEPRSARLFAVDGKISQCFYVIPTQYLSHIIFQMKLK